MYLYVIDPVSSRPQVGSVALAALTVLLVAAFVLVAAATSAAAVAAVVSLAALSALLAVAYVGALSVAVFVVAATTAATVVAITIATGTLHYISSTLSCRLLLLSFLMQFSSYFHYIFQ